MLSVVNHVCVYIYIQEKSSKMKLIFISPSKKRTNENIKMKSHSLTPTQNDGIQLQLCPTGCNNHSIKIIIVTSIKHK